MNAKPIHPSQIPGTPPPPTKLNIEPSSITKISKGGLEDDMLTEIAGKPCGPDRRCTSTPHNIYKNLIKGSRHE